MSWTLVKEVAEREIRTRGLSYDFLNSVIASDSTAICVGVYFYFEIASVTLRPRNDVCAV